MREFIYYVYSLFMHFLVFFNISFLLLHISISCFNEESPRIVTFSSWRQKQLSWQFTSRFSIFILKYFTIPVGIMCQHLSTAFLIADFHPLMAILLIYSTWYFSHVVPSCLLESSHYRMKETWRFPLEADLPVTIALKRQWAPQVNDKQKSKALCWTTVVIHCAPCLSL